MSGSPVSLEVLEKFMAGRKHRLAFPFPIEQRFESDTASRRCQRLTTGILVSAAIYNLFLIADWLLVPDVLWRASVLHFGLVTPWMLTAAWIISRRPSRFVREGLAASIPLVIILQIDYGFATTTSEYAGHYQYVVIRNSALYQRVPASADVSISRSPLQASSLLCHSALVLFVGPCVDGRGGH